MCQFSLGKASLKLHLKKPVLGRGKAKGKIGIMGICRLDVGNAPFITDNLVFFFYQGGCKGGVDVGQLTVKVCLGAPPPKKNKRCYQNRDGIEYEFANLFHLSSFGLSGNCHKK